MSIRDLLKRLIGKRPTSDPRTYHVEVSDSLQVTLSTLAQSEGRPVDKLIPELLSAGLDQYHSKEQLWKKWNSLPVSEKDVLAFVCLGDTNRQIAAKMHISPETVKDRVEALLRKFNVKGRAELRVMFSNWIFEVLDTQN